MATRANDSSVPRVVSESPEFTDDRFVQWRQDLLRAEVSSLLAKGSKSIPLPIVLHSTSWKGAQIVNHLQFSTGMDFSKVVLVMISDPVAYPEHEVRVSVFASCHRGAKSLCGWLTCRTSCVDMSFCLPGTDRNRPSCRSPSSRTTSTATAQRRKTRGSGSLSTDRARSTTIECRRSTSPWTK